MSAESASEFGELVADSETGELLHYAEKPETFVRKSPLVSHAQQISCITFLLDTNNVVV